MPNTNTKIATTSNGKVDEEDFELVTNARMLAPPPPLRREKVILTDWKTTSGKPACFLAWEITASDWAEFMESGRIYKNGAFQRYDNRDEDIRFLAFTLRDQHGNRIWSTTDAANQHLGKVGKASLNKLLEVANMVNSSKPSSAEGNSDGTPSDS